MTSPADDDWSFRSIGEPSVWLLDGLVKHHFGSTFAERKYALYPIELSEDDYVVSQIERQVRVFAPTFSDRLRRATEAAIDLWRPVHRLPPLLDLLGLVQIVGNTAFDRQVRELTSGTVLGALDPAERAQLLASIVAAIASLREFRRDHPLYRTFCDLAADQSGITDESLARALCALVSRHPQEWLPIVTDFTAHFSHVTDRSQSPLGTVFFEIEGRMTADEVKDMFHTGGRIDLKTEHMHLIHWFLSARHPYAGTTTPLRIKTFTQDGVWIECASKRNSEIPVRFDDVPRRTYQMLMDYARDLAAGTEVVSFPQKPSAQELRGSLSLLKRRGQ